MVEGSASGIAATQRFFFSTKTNGHVPFGKEYSKTGCSSLGFSIISKIAAKISVSVLNGLFWGNKVLDLFSTVGNLSNENMKAKKIVPF